MRCPHCQSELQKVKLPLGFYFLCPKCQGRMVSLAVVRKSLSPELLRDMWYSAAFEQAQPAGRACPSCGRPMAEVKQAQLPTLDICRQCQMMWFDAQELEQVPRLDSVSEPDELSPRAKEAMGRMKAESTQARLDLESNLAAMGLWRKRVGLIGEIIGLLQ